MAKRTPGTSVMGPGHSAPTTVHEAEISCPLRIEKNTDGGPAATVMCPEEERTSREASSQNKLSTPRPWLFLCPFCSAVELSDPVYLHTSTADLLSSSALPGAVSGGLYCLACRCCAENWLSAVHAVREERGPALVDTSNTSGSRTAFAASRESDPAPSRASVHGCPLCDRACDAALPSASDPVDSVGCVLDASVVRNSYTGLPQSSGCLTPGNTVNLLSVPAASTLTACSICDEAQATCVCIQCDFGMCEGCRQATHAKGGFRQHEVVTVEQARRRSHLKCVQHPGMTLDLFCDTCATCVCVTCCFGGAHRGHEVFPLVDVVARTARTLAERSTELAALRHDAESTRTQLSSLWSVYETKVDTVRGEIQQCFASLRHILQEREDRLLAQLGEVSSEVRERTTELMTAMSATSSLLSNADDCLRRLPESVSAATLMGISITIQEQQERVSHVSARVVEEAAAAVEGWRYHMHSDGANGCRMASFVLLNTDIANDEGLRQYKEVLADLGRLDASADLRLPVSERGSDVFVKTAVEHSGMEEESVQCHRWGGMAEDCPLPAADCPATGTPTDLLGPKDLGLSCQTTAVEGEETVLVRPSHMGTISVPLPPNAKSSISRELPMEKGDVEGCGYWQRSRSHSARLTLSGPPQLSSGRLPSQFSCGPLRMHGLNLEPPARKAIGATTSSAPIFATADSFEVSGASFKWCRVKEDLLELSDRGNSAVEQYARQRSRERCTAATSLCARDTVPFRVSLPQRRVESYERMEEYSRARREEEDRLPFQALKLHLNTSASDRVRSATMSSSRHGSIARSSSVSAPKQDQGVPQRRTTGLQLEL